MALVASALSIAGKHDFTAVGGRNAQVDHLDGGELFDGASRRESGRQRMEPPPERAGGAPAQLWARISENESAPRSMKSRRFSANIFA